MAAKNRGSGEGLGLRNLAIIESNPSRRGSRASTRRASPAGGSWLGGSREH
jgi:hypothetical protein